MTGERRYHCFANIPTDKAFRKDSVWNIKHVQEMDESDPINDLEDYNEEVLKEVTVNFIIKVKIQETISIFQILSIRTLSNSRELVHFSIVFGNIHHKMKTINTF